MNEADLEKYEQKNWNRLIPGQQISTVIAAISGDTVFLDLSAKSEGVLDANELKDKDGKITVKEGDKINAFFVGLQNGEMTFTTKIAGEKADDSMLENAFKNQIPVEGNVEKEIKGGFEVKIGQSRAFCPYSQMGFRQKAEPGEFVGKHLTFLITEFKEGGKNLLVSNRKIMEAEYEKQLTVLSKTIEAGATVNGTVKSIQNYGAFIEINGFQALLPISEISHERVTDINSVLKVGQEVTVQVIKADWKNEKVSVSMKNLEADPWDNAKEAFPVGTKIDGTISRVQDFGLFVNIAKGIDGLVHISALDVERNTNLKKIYKSGTKMSVTVESVDEANHRIALVPATSKEQDLTAAKYMNSQSDDDGETYNPFAALLKK